jgi:hypothetical protein
MRVQRCEVWHQAKASHLHLHLLLLLLLLLAPQPVAAHQKPLPYILLYL